MNRRKLHIGFIFFASFLLGMSTIFAQNKTEINKKTEKLINKGVSNYNSAEYEKAEKDFRKALAKDPLNAVAAYDMGLTLTEEDKNNEAARFFNKAGKTAEDEKLKNKAFFNEGNVWLQKKKYEKAIEAYKNALRNDPADEEARYNLAIAMDKLKKQQKKNKKNDKKKNNKENKDKKKQNKDQNKKDNNKDNKDQNKKNKKNDKNKDQKQGKDKKDKKGDKKKDQKKDGKDKKDKQNKQGDKKKEQNKQNQGDNKQKAQPKPGEQNKQQQGKPGEQKSKLSPQQVKQLLVGLKNKEQKTQKKIQARLLKAKSTKKKTEKDW